MLGTAPTIVRLSLHVTAAAVWVGGQLTLGGLVPTLRRAAPEATAAVARQFARLAWPAYVVLLGTGIWNVSASDPSQQTGAWKAVLSVKIAVVVLAGVAAFAHQRVTGRRGIAIWGALAGLSSLSALVMGVALSG
jgi:putative copper export protein